MAVFLVVPFALRDAGLPAAAHWQVYLPVLLASVVVVLPLFRVADRRGRGKVVLTAAIATLAAAMAILALAGRGLATIVAGLFVFFCAFTLLEATLPSLVSRFAPRASRGSAIGVFSAMQYLGMFAGGAAGGLLLKHAGPPAVYGAGAALALAWLVAGATMGEPPAAAETSLSMGRT
jgi:MFS family permease